MQKLIGDDFDIVNWNWSVILIFLSGKIITKQIFNLITGYVADEDEWNQIFQVAKDNNLMVFCDELYRGSRHDGTALPSAAATYEKAVSLSGVSKVYGLPGIRMGEFCLGWLPGISLRNPRFARSLMQSFPLL